MFPIYLVTASFNSNFYYYNIVRGCPVSPYYLHYAVHLINDVKMDKEGTKLLTKISSTITDMED